MQIHHKISLLFLSLIFFCCTTVADTDTPPPTDLSINTAIQQMVIDKKIPAGLTAETKNGIVMLSGSLETDHDVAQTVETIATMSGVKDIETSKLKVSKVNQPLVDVIITAKIKGLFNRENVFGKPVEDTKVNIETRDSTVYLSGEADSKNQVKNAMQLAKSVYGVISVNSTIKTNH